MLDRHASTINVKNGIPHQKKKTCAMGVIEITVDLSDLWLSVFFDRKVGTTTLASVPVLRTECILDNRRVRYPPSWHQHPTPLHVHPKVNDVNRDPGLLPRVSDSISIVQSGLYQSPWHAVNGQSSIFCSLACSPYVYVCRAGESTATYAARRPCPALAWLCYLFTLTKASFSEPLCHSTSIHSSPPPSTNSTIRHRQYVTQHCQYSTQVTS